MTYRQEMDPINVCARCGFRMDLGVAISPRCGVPNLRRSTKSFAE